MPGLIESVLAFIIIAPLMVSVLISIIYLFWLYKSTAIYKHIIILLINAIIIFLILLSIPLLLEYSNHPRYNITSDSVRRTDDGLFYYRLEVVNPFQRNTHARLYLNCTISNESFYIYFDLLDFELRGFSTRNNNFVWVVLEYYSYGIYFMRLPPGREIIINDTLYEIVSAPIMRNHKFIINIYGRTYERIFFLWGF